MSPHTRLAVAALAVLLSLILGVATASADLRSPVLGETTNLSHSPSSLTYGSAIASDGNATFVAYSEVDGGVIFQRIGAAGTEIGAKRELQSPGTGSVGLPKISVSGDDVYVAWIQSAYSVRESHVAVAASHDGGRTFSTATIAGHTTGHGAWDVQMGADGNNVWVAWVDDRNRIWTAGSRDGGQSWPCQTVVTSLSDDPDGGGDYSLAVDGPRIHWVWISDDFDIYTRRSGDRGRTLDQTRKLYDGPGRTEYPGVPTVAADGGVVAISYSHQVTLPRDDHTGTDFGADPVVMSSRDGGDTWSEQTIGSAANRCVGTYCVAPYSTVVDGLDVYVAWRGQGTIWLAHSHDGGASFDAPKDVGDVAYTWHAQSMPSVAARRDTVVVTWHSSPDPATYNLDPVAAFSSDRGETFNVRTIDDGPGQDLWPVAAAWGPDPQGAGFAWMAVEHSFSSGDYDVKFRPLSASEPDVAVQEVEPMQAAQGAHVLAAGRPTTVRVKLRSAAPAKARVPLGVDLAYDEDGRRVERHVDQDVVLSPGISTIELLADDPVTVGAGRVTATVKVSPDLYDTDRSNDTGEGSRAVLQPRPLTVLFVPIAADDESQPGCRDIKDVMDGAEEHIDASWPVDPRYVTFMADCQTPLIHKPGLTDAGLMGPGGLMQRLDREKWSGLSIDKVVGVTPQGWFSRQSIPALKTAVGVAPLGGSLDAAIVERQNTGGWVVAHELAHQLGWTQDAGAHGNHLDDEPAPGYWVAKRLRVPDSTLDFMNFSTAGASVTDTTGRWISSKTWDYLAGTLASSALGATAARGVAAAGQKVLSLTGTVKADGTVAVGQPFELDGEPDPAGDGPYTVEQLAADGTVLQTRHFGAVDDLGPMGGDDATGEEHAVTADAGFSLRLPALPGARTLRIRKGDDVLLERHRSAAAPTVSVTTPAAGAKVPVGSDMTIAWNAGDADGDALVHTVSVSTDGGDSWRALGEQTTGSSITVKAAGELLGDDVRVRVTTSDGWNTTSDTSGSFTVGGDLTDGAVVATDWSNGAIWTVNLDGSGAKQLGPRGRHVRWSPDGRKLAWDATNLFTADADGSNVTQVTNVPAGDRYWEPVWNGDGDKLLADHQVGGYHDANQVVDVATGAATQFGAKNGELCDVSLDGARVLGRYGLYGDAYTLWHADGTEGKEYPRPIGGLGCAQLSPDNRYLVTTKYRSDSDSRIDVIVWDTQTGTMRNLTDGQFGGYNAYPTWSPTGDWIVWGSNKDRSGSTGFGATDLWKIHPDGTGAQKVLDGAALGNVNVEQPDVQPARGAAPEPEPTLQELRPVAAGGGPYAGTEGAAVTLDARASKPGADGAAVTAYRWDLDGDGAYDDATGAQPAVTFPDQGDYSVGVEVTDAKGRTATAPAEVKVANADPVISDARVGDGEPATFSATVKDPGAQDSLEATIDWGDGTGPEPVSVIAADDGYRVMASHDGAGATVKLTVRDGDGGHAAAVAGRVLAPADAPPSADDGAAEVRSSEAVDIDLPSRDPEGDRLTYEVVDRPAHGTLALRAADPLAGPAAPDVTYVADSDYTGTDTFTYRASDGVGESRVATVTVTVKPLPATEGGQPAPPPDPDHPAPEPTLPDTPRGPGREGDRPVDQKQVDQVVSGGGSTARTPTAAQVLSLPSARRCVSRRRFRIRVRRIKGQTPYRTVSVSVNGKRVRVLRKVRDTAAVDLRGLPKGRFKVAIAVTLRSGKVVRTTRRYHTCVARSKSTPGKKKGGRL